MATRPTLAPLRSTDEVAGQGRAVVDLADVGKGRSQAFQDLFCAVGDAHGRVVRSGQGLPHGEDPRLPVHDHEVGERTAYVAAQM